MNLSEVVRAIERDDRNELERLRESICSAADKAIFIAAIVQQIASVCEHLAKYLDPQSARMDLVLRKESVTGEMEAWRWLTGLHELTTFARGVENALHHWELAEGFSDER